MTSRNYRTTVLLCVTGYFGTPSYINLILQIGVDFVWNEMSIDDKFLKGFLSLTKLNPFLGIEFSSMKKYDKSERIPTIGVSDCIYYNSDFLQSLPEAEFNFVLMHELYHVALLHPARIGTRNRELFNIACDYYVNSLIATEYNLPRDGTPTMVNGVQLLLSSQGVYDTCYDNTQMTVEEIYDSLVDAYGLDESVAIAKRILDATHIGSDISPADASTLTQIVEQALSTSAGYDVIGSSSDFIRKVKATIVKPIKWQNILRKYLRSMVEVETSLSSPDKRYIYRDTILPGEYNVNNDAITDVVIAVDVSGSVSDEMINKTLGQIRHLLKDVSFNGSVLCWDTEVTSFEPLTSKSKVDKIKIVGYGGTTPECVFNYYKEHKLEPALTIFITDGFFHISSNSIPKKYRDIVWLIYCDSNNSLESFKPPFGKKYKL